MIPKHSKAIPHYSKPKFSIKKQKIIKYLALGYKNKEISSIIGITEGMVKNYTRDIYDALGFNNRTEIALWYVKQEHDNKLPQWLKYL